MFRNYNSIVSASKSKNATKMKKERFLKSLLHIFRDWSIFMQVNACQKFKQGLYNKKMCSFFSGRIYFWSTEVKKWSFRSLFQGSDMYKRVIVLKDQISTQVSKIWHIDFKSNVFSGYMRNFSDIFVVKLVKVGFSPCILLL